MECVEDDTGRHDLTPDVRSMIMFPAQSHPTIPNIF